MSVATKFLMRTTQVVGAILWLAIIVSFDVLGIIGELLTAVNNNLNTLLCYNAL